MRAGVYTRISLDRDGKAEGVARQRQDARELAARRDWEVVHEYDDNDVSASGKSARPGFESLLRDIEAGSLDAVVAWTLDRLTRDRRDTVRLIEACQKHKVTIALVRGSDFDMATPAGRLVADLLASVARNEIEVKSDRQKRANRQRAEAGRPHRGRRAFGYDAKGLAVVEDEAALIRSGFDMIVAGASLRAVVRAWNDAGALSTAGNPWRPDSVRTVLMNPRYAAVRYYEGERVAEGEWPAIVSEATWQAARAILTNPSRSTVKDRSVKFLLTSIAECGRCDDGAKVATSRTQHGSRIYKCHERGDLARKADPIDELVESVVIARLSQADAADLLVNSTSSDDVQVLRTEANANRERLTEAADLFASGAITGAQLAEITKATQNKVAEIESRIANTAATDALAGIVGASDVEAAWHALDISRQRAIVSELFERIVLEPVAQGARTFRPESVRLAWRR